MNPTKKSLWQALMDAEPKPTGPTVGEIHELMKSLQKGVISTGEAMAAFGDAWESMSVPEHLPPYAEADAELSAKMHVEQVGESTVYYTVGKTTVEEDVMGQLKAKATAPNGLLALAKANEDFGKLKTEDELFRERAKLKKAEREKKEWAAKNPWKTTWEEKLAKGNFVIPVEETSTQVLDYSVKPLSLGEVLHKTEQYPAKKEKFLKDYYLGEWK